MNKSLEVFITESAQNDIINIAEYIAKDNKIVAINIIDTFSKSFELLANYPETGSTKSELIDKTIRIYSVKKNFTICYRINQDRIEILRILTRYQNIFAVLI